MSTIILFFYVIAIVLFVDLCIIRPSLVVDNPIWRSILEWEQQLEDAAIVITPYLPRISILDFFGSILSCKVYRQQAQFPKIWLETLISCTLLQFGGTTMTGILLGQTPSWIISKTAYPAFLLAWWLTFFSPFDAYWNFTKSFPIIIDGYQLGAAISSGVAVTAWGMDKAIFNEYSASPHKIRDSVLTCLLCGTFSSCGGGIVGDWLGFYRIPSFTCTATPTIFSSSKKRALSAVCKSFVMSVIYYILMNPSGYLPWEPSMSKGACHLVIVLLQVLNYTMLSVSTSLDLYAAIAETFAFVVEPEDSLVVMGEGKGKKAKRDDLQPIKGDETEDSKKKTKNKMKKN